MRREPVREKHSALDENFEYHGLEDAFDRPTPGGQQHSPPKLTSDGGPRYGRTIFSVRATRLIQAKGVPPRPTAKTPQVPGANDHVMRAVGLPMPRALARSLTNVYVWRDHRTPHHQLLTRTNSIPLTARSACIWMFVGRIPKITELEQRQDMDVKQVLIHLHTKGFHELLNSVIQIPNIGGRKKRRI